MSYDALTAAHLGATDFAAACTCLCQMREVLAISTFVVTLDILSTDYQSGGLLKCARTLKRGLLAKRHLLCCSTEHRRLAGVEAWSTGKEALTLRFRSLIYGPTVL